MILVTGGAGYVGSHYLLHERGRGREAVVLDSLARGHRKAVLGALLVEGNVADRAILDRIFTGFPIEAVVHFAAFAYVGESVCDPGLYFRNNVVSTLALLEAMVSHGVSRLLFSSSCATYGVPESVPIHEQHVQKPINPYGESKLACERMLEAFDRAHGLRYAALRYFNAAGADEEGRIGESHDPETHLIPLALQVAAASRAELDIFGADYPTADGTCVRDYVHVMDLAAAHGLALERLMDGSPSFVLNLGSERGHSVREVVRACERATGRSIRMAEQPRRPGDPAVLVASADRARQELGWRPRYGDLEAIARTAWRWLQDPRF